MDGSARSDGEAEGATLLWVARNLATALWIDRALQHALLWPLLACPLSPMGGIWDRFASTAQSARANVRHVLRFARCDDRDAWTDASRVLRNKFQVSRVQNWGVMSSLEVVFGVLETL